MTGRRAAVAGALAATVLVGCGSPGPASISPTTGPSVSSTTAGVVLPTPGQPLDVDGVLAAMRASRRPGGVPDQLESEPIAQRIAEAVWTIDGDPWDTVTVGGSCGPQRCSLELMGTHDDIAGSDAWTFSIDPGAATVEVVEHTLAALPDELVDDLDGLAREHEALDGLVLASARWLGPAGPEQFVLSYRGGDEEESCSADVTVDAAARRIVDVARGGC